MVLSMRRVVRNVEWAAHNDYAIQEGYYRNKAAVDAKSSDALLRPAETNHGARRALLLPDRAAWRMWRASPWQRNIATRVGAESVHGTMARMQQESVRVVVAAVIERDGLILAARRTGPAELAGRWEFPGGKVEAGESDSAALIRECREEIGVRITVGERIGPEYTTPSGAMVVRTYLAALDGEAEPETSGSHDALEWVRAGTAEARALPWLDGDLLILDALDERAAARGIIRVA